MFDTPHFYLSYSYPWHYFSFSMLFWQKQIRHFLRKGLNLPFMFNLHHKIFLLFLFLFFFYLSPKYFSSEISLKSLTTLQVIHIFCHFMPCVTNLHSFTSIITTKDISDESSSSLYWVQNFNARYKLQWMLWTSRNK